MQSVNLDTRASQSVETTLNIIGGKWKCVIIYHLLSGTKRFNELRRLIPDITQRMLIRQLRELEEVGILTRTVYAEGVPKVEYTLTEFGQSLQPLMSVLIKWGQEHSHHLSAIE